MARSLSQRGSRADQQPGESPDLGIRQNCETLRRFINLHVPYTQKQAGQFDQTAVSNTLAAICRLCIYRNLLLKQSVHLEVCITLRAICFPTIL